MGRLTLLTLMGGHNAMWALSNVTVFLTVVTLWPIQSSQGAGRVDVNKWRFLSEASQSCKAACRAYHEYQKGIWDIMVNIQLTCP